MTAAEGRSAGVEGKMVVLSACDMAIENTNSSFVDNFIKKCKNKCSATEWELYLFRHVTSGSGDVIGWTFANYFQFSTFLGNLSPL